MTADTIRIDLAPDDFDIVAEAAASLKVPITTFVREAALSLTKKEPTDHDLTMMLNDIYWWALMIRQKGTSERDRFHVRMAHHIMHGVAQHTQEEYFAIHPEEAIPEEYRRSGAVDTPAGA